MRWIKYGTQSDVRFTLIKRGVVDLAVTGDYTPAAADSAISKDGGNYADTTNTVAVIGGTPTRGVVGWKLTISATEAQAAELNIQIVDAATKAIEDQFLTVYTYGNASAKFAGDWSDIVRLGLTGLANATPGAAGGLFIAGTNAPVTITGSGDALTLSSSGGNGNGLNVSGNGSGDAVKATGGATGNALELVGGGTSGDGLKVTTTAGHGMNIAATGTSKHGITATGGNAGTSDGIKGAAGTGGVDIRGNITGNITGNLSGSAGSVTGAVGSVTGAVGSVTGAVGSVTGAVGSVTGAVGSVTGNVGGNVVGSVASVTARVTANTDQIAGGTVNALIAGRVDANAQVVGTGAIVAGSFANNAIVDAGVNLTKLNNLPEGIKKNTALSAFEFFMVDSADHVTGKTGLTVAGAVSIDGGAFGALTNTPATEVANGIYKIDLAAADLNGTTITLKFTSAGADATLISLKTSL